MRKLSVITLIILLTGCHHNQEYSFDNLTAAFFQWYFKSNPTIALKNGFYEFGHAIESFEAGFLKENLSDLKRFDLELSQIDKASLPENKQVDYSILSSVIDRLIYSRVTVQEYTWNPVIFQEIIQSGIQQLVYGQLGNTEKAAVLVEKLRRIPGFVQQAQFIIRGTTQVHKSLALQYLEQNILILQDLPLNIQADITTLDLLDQQIAVSINALRQHEHWLQDLPEDLDYRIGETYYEDGFDLLTDHRYILAYTLSAVEQDLIFTQNEMFYVTYPFYLQQNDEPVWVSRKDTLDVIQWGIDRIYDHPANPDYLLDQAVTGIENLSEYAAGQKLFNPSGLPNLTVSAAENIRPSGFHAELDFYGDRYSDYSAEYKIAMSAPSINTRTGRDYYFDFNLYSYSIMNMLLVLPGNLYELGSLDKNLSATRGSFPNRLIQSGWPWYAAQTMIDNGFENTDYRYRLEYLRKKLSQIDGARLQYQMHTGDMTMESVLENLQETAFQSEYEALRIYHLMQVDPFYYIMAYLGEGELHHLQTQVRNDLKENFSLQDFHQSLFLEGFISFPDLQFLLLD